MFRSKTSLCSAVKPLTDTCMFLITDFISLSDTINVPSFLDTMKIHQLMADPSGRILHRRWSCYCNLWCSEKSVLQKIIKGNSVLHTCAKIFIDQQADQDTVGSAGCEAMVSLPPPKKEVMFLVRSVSVCLSVCPSDYSQTCERILTKFFGVVGHGSRTK